MTRTRWWLTLVACLALVSLTVLGPRWLAGRAGVGSSSASGKLSAPPLWPAPDFALTDQRRGSVTPHDLRGQPWIANFIFTQCQSICPLLTTKMVQLQRQLAGVDVRFVSFSVDPAHDTPPVLADYAQRWNADEPRWSLLATDAASLKVVTAGFHVTAAPNPTPSEPDPIIHSSTFVLVDSEGLVRGMYDSEDRDDFRALARDLRVLAQAEGAQAPELAIDGATLYHQLSCANCHQRPELAPSLRGLAGTKRPLDAAQRATFDATYVKESILAPEAKRVAGYPLHMPSYDGLVDLQRLNTLVDYVLSLPPDAPSSAQAADRTEVDPVCQMQVRVVEGQVPEATFAGHRHFFCSTACRDRFVAHPEAFARPH